MFNVLAGVYLGMCFSAVVLQCADWQLCVKCRPAFAIFVPLVVLQRVLNSNTSTLVVVVNFEINVIRFPCIVNSSNVTIKLVITVLPKAAHFERVVFYVEVYCGLYSA